MKLPTGAGPRRYAATVAGRSGDDVIVELGPRVQGMVPAEEFEEVPDGGATIQVALRGREEGLWLFSVREASVLAAWDELEIGSLVKGRVIGMNKGGLELKVDGMEAFLPASQVALSHVEDLAAFADETMVCRVLEIDPQKQRIVVSRRAVLEDELRSKRDESMEVIREGGVVRGKVKRFESFGAFVEIAPGIEGLLHVSNIAHRRVERPEEELKLGQDVEVLILKIEEGGRRIGLGLKQLLQNPWDAASERFREDSVVNGTVRRIADFGAFVELEPGVDGLLHVSQFGRGRSSAQESVSIGEEIAVRILAVDVSARRISLSRLDSRGAVLGSEESVDGDEIDEVLNNAPNKGIGTNLGALFKKALGDESS